MELRVDGLRTIVTAGGSGLGRASAEALSDAGAKVVICDIDPGAIGRLQQARPEIGAMLADVSSEQSISQFFDSALQQLGGLDCLVNNAGVSGPTAAIEDIALADWRKVLDVNLSGVFLSTRASVPHLKAAGGGSIINMSSVSGRLGVPLRTPYAATKWGVIGLTQSWAKELGPSGIRVNAILPGFVEGERMDRVIANRAHAVGISVEEMRQRYLAKVSLRRMVSPRDVAMQVLYLASPLSGLMSGQSVGVCGNVEYL